MSVTFTKKASPELEISARQIGMEIAEYIRIEVAAGVPQNTAVQNSFCTIIGIYAQSLVPRKILRDLLDESYAMVEVERCKPPG